MYVLMYLKRIDIGGILVVLFYEQIEENVADFSWNLMIVRKCYEQIKVFNLNKNDVEVMLI